MLLIPIIGYLALWLQPLGGTGDAFRALLTALLTVAGLGFLTLRLSLQAGELQGVDTRLRLLAAGTEQTQDMILITVSNGRVEHANDAFVRALGYSRDELARCSFPDLLEHGFHDVDQRIRHDLRARGVWRGTLFRRRRDGSTFPAACTITALREHGAITHLVGVERDITEELRLQEQLWRAERLSAVGELVAGVAHEINNPLQTVVGSVELMLEDTGAIDPPRSRNRAEGGGPRRADRPQPARIRSARDAGARSGGAESTCHRSRRAPRVPVPAEVDPAVDGPFRRPRHGSRQPGRTAADRHEPPHEHRAGGRLFRRWRRDNPNRIDRRPVHTRGRGQWPQHHEELRGRIFEPFFTTKPIGEGRGARPYSISHGIASSHGGTLELLPSEHGAGVRGVSRSTMSPR